MPRREMDPLLLSEDTPSDSRWRATDASRTSGKPLGNAALAGSFFTPTASKPEKDLQSQPRERVKAVLNTSHLSLMWMARRYHLWIHRNI